MLKKSLLLAVLGIGFIYACKNNPKDNFVIEATYKNADKLFLPNNGNIKGKVFLVEISYGKEQSPLAIDSATINSTNGNFQLSSTSKKEGIYEVVFGENLLSIPIINDAKEIKIETDLSKKDDFYDATGSTATKNLETLIADFGKKNYVVAKSFNAIDSLKKINAPDSLVINAINAKNNGIQDLNSYLTNFLQSNNNEIICSIALGWASRSFPQQDFEAALDGSVKKYPTSDLLKNMQKTYFMQKEQAQESQKSSWVGKKAPELNLPDANGKIISLASFHGKYLLIDFWASWCGPCRMENPNVVKAYNEFKGKKFAILGVSLDKNKDSWQQAIKEDNLAWAQVSDLNEWNSSAVKTYQFQGIPFNVLVDPTGKIIGEELRGDALESKLKEVMP